MFVLGTVQSEGGEPVVPQPYDMPMGLCGLRSSGIETSLSSSFEG